MLWKSKAMVDQATSDSLQESTQDGGKCSTKMEHLLSMKKEKSWTFLEGLIELTTRNAKNVRKDPQAATPLPSALLPVESHTPSVMLILESATHATLRTKIALKLKNLANKNAKSWHSVSATERLVSARSAQKVLDVFQELHATINARRDQLTTCTTAHGNLPSHNASKIQRVP